MMEDLSMMGDEDRGSRMKMENVQFRAMTPGDRMPERKPYRLPLTVTPERYEFRLTPDLSSGRFTGEERVAIQVNEPVREICLNAVELAIQDVSIKAKSGKTIRGDVTLDPENEQAALQFTETVGPGPWELQIKFSGILNDKLHGFYRSAYKNADGEEKTLATTQFSRRMPGAPSPAGTSRRSRRSSIALVVDQG
jgi:aminopeptidase N